MIISTCFFITSPICPFIPLSIRPPKHSFLYPFSLCFVLTALTNAHFLYFVTSFNFDLKVYAWVLYVHRAQNIFRQAMRSPVILFHVVPSSMRSQYEQISHNEHKPRGSFDVSGRFSPDSLTNDPVNNAGLDHAAHRLAQHRSHSSDNHTDTSSPMHHPGGPAGKPPLGHASSPQRGLSPTPTSGFSKKVGRRLGIQLRKGISWSIYSSGLIFGWTICRENSVNCTNLWKAVILDKKQKKFYLLLA